MQERLSALAVQIEAITRRIRTLGLSRTAEDLGKVSVELRRLGDEAAGRAARDRDDEQRPPAPGAGPSAR